MEQTNFNRGNKKPKSIDSTMMYGKVPPQAREIEDAVLGSVLMERYALSVAIELLKPECFYTEASQIIFTTILQMYKNNTPVDLLTVVNELKKISQLEIIGGPYYLTKLTNNTSGPHIEAHCRIVLQKYIQREIIRLAAELASDAYEENADVFELADKVDLVGAQIQNSLFIKDYSHISDAVLQLSNKVELLKESKDSISGVDTGYHKLNEKTHGWQNTDLIILAARPSVGKTAYALNLAKNAAKKFKEKSLRNAVGFFSLEMSMVQLVQRIVCNEGGIYMDCLSTGKNINDHFYGKAMDEVSNLPIYVDDTASLNILQFKAKARRMVNKHNVGLIIIDYLQLMSGTEKRTNNREQEISSISRGLKIVAKELNIPIIALSQLSRQIEGRGNSEPKLSDLRESGAIEQDADVVCFLYDFEENGRMKIAKHRNGSLGDIDYHKQNSIQRWSEISEIEYKPDIKPGQSWKELPVEKEDEEEEKIF